MANIIEKLRDYARDNPRKCAEAIKLLCSVYEVISDDCDNCPYGKECNKKGCDVEKMANDIKEALG